MLNRSIQMCEPYTIHNLWLRKSAMCTPAYLLPTTLPYSRQSAFHRRIRFTSRCIHASLVSVNTFGRVWFVHYTCAHMCVRARVIFSLASDAKRETNEQTPSCVPGNATGHNMRWLPLRRHRQQVGARSHTYTRAWRGDNACKPTMDRWSSTRRGVSFNVIYRVCARWKMIDNDEDRHGGTSFARGIM